MSSYSLIDWSTSLSTISNTSLNSTFVQVGMDMNGNVTVIWLENGIVKSSNQLLGGSLSSSSSLSNSGASSPQLVVDLNGNATAIWVESGNVLTSSQPFGGSWSTAYSLNSTGGSSPALAVDTSGNVVAIWVSSSGIESNTKLFGGSWAGSPDVLSSTGSSPQVSIGSSSYVIAIWYALTSSINTIYSSDKSISGTWSSATMISTSGLNSIYPQIAVDSNGNGLAIWYTYSLSGSQYTDVILQYAKYSYTGSTWATPTNLSTAGLVNPALLQSAIIFSSLGSAVAIWTTSLDGAARDLYTAYLNTSGKWSEIRQLAHGNYEYSFALSIDLRNNIYLLHMFYDTSTSTVTINNYVSVLNDLSPNTWASNGTLSNGYQNGFPTIATTSNTLYYYGVAAWISYNGSNTIIQFVDGSGNVIQPPSSPSVVQNEQNFGVFQEYTNTITWSASPSSITTNYIIYRNNIQISEVTPDILSIIDHNAIQSGSVTYSIVAVNLNTGEFSTSATVTYP